MEANLQNAYVQEIKYQIRMLHNLKRWLKNIIIFSSFALVLIMFGASYHQIITIIGSVLMIFCILSSIIIGFGLKKGQDNVNKLIDQMEKKQ